MSSVDFPPLVWLVLFCAQPCSVAFGAELEKEVTQAAEVSTAVQAVLETEIGEHDALKSTARTACEALEVKRVQSRSSLGSRLVALSG